jgi:hypothetical protein
MGLHYDNSEWLDLYNKYDIFFNWTKYIKIIQQENTECNISRFRRDDGFSRSSVDGFNALYVLEHKYSHYYLDARHLITILTGSQLDENYRSDIRQAFLDVVDRIKMGDPSLDMTIVLQLFTRLKLARYELMKYTECKQHRNTKYDHELWARLKIFNQEFNFSKTDIIETLKAPITKDGKVSETKDDKDSKASEIYNGALNQKFAESILSHLPEQGTEKITLVRYRDYDKYKIRTTGENDPCPSETLNYLTYFTKPRKRIIVEPKCKLPDILSLPKHLIELNKTNPLAVTFSMSPVTERDLHDVNYELVQNIYTYEDVPGAINFWVDFAASNFTGHLLEGLIAQEELMVWQSPYLIPLLKTKANLVVRSDDGLEKQEKDASRALEGSPTPLIVLGVNKHFTIRDTWRVIEPSYKIATVKPPKPINILAMAAPFSGYSSKEGGLSDHILTAIDYFNTAYAAFSLAKDTFTSENIVIHTGAWGCGMFGGDIRIALYTQMLAAKLVGVHLRMYLQPQEHIEAFTNVKQYMIDNHTRPPMHVGFHQYVLSNLESFKQIINPSLSKD